jgi:hypothetical protein
MQSNGFTGIYINDMTYSNDILLVTVFLLLSVFAVFFRRNVSVFHKMISDVADKEQKNSIFDTAEKKNFLFNAYMGFQTLVLLGIYAFSLATKCGYIKSPDIQTTLLCVAGLIFIFFLFYLFKRFLFDGLLYVFAESDAQKKLKIRYKSLFRLWSVFLYFPVFWILLIGNYFVHATIILIISYICIKILLAYRFIFTFFGKNIWLLFLNLYLCAQEIVPLAFLYEGLIYIYRIIDKSNIWQ